MCIIGIAVIMGGGGGGGGCCCVSNGGCGCDCCGGGITVGVDEVIEDDEDEEDEEVWRDFKTVMSGPGAPTRSCLKILLACWPSVQSAHFFHSLGDTEEDEEEGFKGGI